MPDARILQACDAAAALILAGWADASPLDGVQVAFVPSINLTEDAEPVHAGRQIYVIPPPEAYHATMLTRSDQQRDYMLRVLMVERYLPQEGDPLSPTNDWIRERVTFFEQVIFNPLANQGTVLLDEMSPAIDTTATVRVLFDPDVLLQHKTFWAWAEFPYMENTDLNGRVDI